MLDIIIPELIDSNWVAITNAAALAEVAFEFRFLMNIMAGMEAEEAETESRDNAASLEMAARVYPGIFERLYKPMVIRLHQMKNGIAVKGEEP